MRRIYLAMGLLACLAGVVLYGNTLVGNTVAETRQAVQAVQAAAEAGQYTLARELSCQTVRYFRAGRTGLGLFLRSDLLCEADAALAALPPAARENQLPELRQAVSAADSRLDSIRASFFGVI